MNMLPKEVLSLPELTHLFGKFKLPCELGITATRASSQTRTIFSGDSKLETLAGFVLGETHFQQIILNMKKLRKVKVLAESTPSSDIIGHLVSSFKKRLISSNPLDSLSVDFGDHSIDFLDTLDASGCSLTSIKLHGCLTSLPIFITSLLGLSKLHLVSTGLDSSILSTLQELHLLICLKLVENRLEFGNGSFTVEKKGFQSLQRLYIQAKKLPKFNIAKGAMQHLYSLQLISEDISGVHEDTVKHLKGLKEVTLDHSVGDDTRKSWEAELKQHKNRPLLWIKTDA